ncbi:MAG: zinc-ribbon domain-containing protein [Hyphomicrobiales bacterium]
MIITCPQCATCYDVSEEFLPAKRQELECPECAATWFYPPESAAKVTGEGMETISRLFPPPADPQARSDDRLDHENEAARLVAASAKAQRTFAERRTARLAALRGWSAYGSCVFIFLVASVAFREPVTRAFPAASLLYKKAGIDVNLNGVEVRGLAYEHTMEEGIPVLKITGEIANVSSNERKPPILRLSLQSGENLEIYTWKVNIGEEGLKPGDSANFTTKLASPPNNVREVQIRFAGNGEIG